MKLKRHITLTAITVLCLLALYMGAHHPTHGQSADPITARVTMTPITSLDPVGLLPTDLAGRDLAENLFIGLVRYDPATNTIQPALASDWAVSADGLTWRFNLRNDIQWVRYDPASGQARPVRPVVAGDFSFAMRRACDAPPPNPVARTVYIIAGCRTIATTNPMLIDDFFIARELGVRVVNARTLEIRLLFPAPYFPALLALPEFRPVPREAITQAGAQNADWTQPVTLMSSGPWAVAALDGGAMTLIRNPSWPDALAGNIERVEVNFMPAPDVSRIAAGSIDFARLDLASAAALAATLPEAVFATPGATITLLGFSAERAITNDPGLRRALALAIDRAAIIGQVFPGAALPTWRLTPPAPMAMGGPGEAPDNRGFLPDVARATLAAVRPQCRFGERLDFAIDDSPQSAALARAIIDGWKATLGCNPGSFNLVVSSREGVERIANGTFSTIRNTDPSRPHLWLYSWTPDHRDIHAWAGDGLHCQYGFVRSYAPCGEADSLIDAGALEADPAKRLDAYTRAETLWFGAEGSFPVAPLFLSIEAIGHSVRLVGATPVGAARFDLWQIRQ